jgi:hypothetical protein
VAASQVTVEAGRIDNDLYPTVHHGWNSGEVHQLIAVFLGVEHRLH